MLQMLDLVLLLLYPTQPLLLQSPSLSRPWTWPARIRLWGTASRSSWGQPRAEEMCMTCSWKLSRPRALKDSSWEEATACTSILSSCGAESLPVRLVLFFCLNLRHMLLFLLGRSSVHQESGYPPTPTPAEESWGTSESLQISRCSFERVGTRGLLEDVIWVLWLVAA